MYITKQDFLFIKDNCFAKLIGLNTDLNAADESAKSRTTPTPCPSIVKDLCGSVTFREIFLAFCHKEPSVVPNETGVLHMSRDTVPCRGGLPLVCTHTLGFVGNFLWLHRYHLWLVCKCTAKVPRTMPTDCCTSTMYMCVFARFN